MNSQKTLVWMDHREAKIFQLTGGEFVESDVAAPKAHVHRHPRGSGGDTQHPEDAERFFSAVATALAGADPILLVGPSTAKAQFLGWLATCEPQLEKRIAAVEAADHPTPAQLVAHAKRSFGMPVRLGR